MAGPGAVQLGDRLVRRGAGERGQQGPLRPLDRRRGERARHQAHLWRAVTAFQPGCQLAAPAGPEARRSSPARAEQRGALVGDHAGRHEARRRRDPGNDLAHHRGAGRSRRARPRAHDRHRRGPGHQVRRPLKRQWAARRCRVRQHQRQAHRGLAVARRRLQMPGRVQGGRHDQRRRSAAALFHLGHYGQAQAGAPQPSQLSRRRALDHVLAGPETRRRASQHLLARLGQARLEHVLRAVECRRDRTDRQPGAVQRQGAAGRAGALRRHHLLRAADGVASHDPGGPRRCEGRAARGLRRGRAAQPRGHQQGSGGLGPHHPRWLRPDRDHGADRQFAGPDGQAGRDGPADAGLSSAGARCRRHADRRRRDLPRPQRASGRPA